MNRRKAFLGFLLVAIPLMSNAEEATKIVTPQVRSTIRADMSSSCIAGRPSVVQSEAQIQAHKEFCNCAADFTSQNIKEEDAEEIEKEVAEYERSKKIGDVLMKLTDAAYLACKGRYFK